MHDMQNGAGVWLDEINIGDRVRIDGASGRDFDFREWATVLEIDATRENFWVKLDDPNSRYTMNDFAPESGVKCYHLDAEYIETHEVPDRTLEEENVALRAQVARLDKIVTTFMRNVRGI